MAPRAVVEHVDVVEDGVSEFESSCPTLPVEQFDLHARPEALHHGVVECITDRAKGWQQSGFASSLGDGPGGELSAVVRVNNAAMFRPPLLDRHVEGVHHQLGVLDRVDRPADDPPAAGVHHTTTEDSPFARLLLGDVRGSQFVKVTAGELALDQIAARGHTLDSLDLGRSG